MSTKKGKTRQLRRILRGSFFEIKKSRAAFSECSATCLFKFQFYNKLFTITFLGTFPNDGGSIRRLKRRRRLALQ